MLTITLRVFIFLSLLFFSVKNIKVNFFHNPNVVIQESFLPRKQLSKRLKKLSNEGDFSSQTVKVAAILYKLDKRSELARFIKSLEHLTKNQYDEFFEIFPTIMATDTKNRSTYVEVISNLSVEPSFRKALLEELRMKAPDWGRALAIQAYSDNNVKPNQFLEIISYYPDNIQEFISLLIQRGDWALAYSSFEVFLRANNYDAHQGPFNKEFKKIDVPSPFNWQVNNEYVEYESNGVEILYFGQGRPKLLTQTFPVMSGDYKLITRFSGGVRENAGEIGWKVFCKDGNETLLKTQLQGKPTIKNTSEVDFSVPDQNCNWVILSLEASPGVFPGRSELELYSVEINEIQ